MMLSVIEKKELIADCMKGHYLLMEHKRFWYDKNMQELSKVLCVTASDLRKELNTTDGAD